MRGLIRVFGAVITVPLVLAIGVALMVLWQLWATDFSYDRSQSVLSEEFEAGNPSQPVGRLAAEAIGLDAFIMAGVSNDALTDGPGRYPGTADPGAPGNMVIAGRRSTYGAPFAQIEDLAVGDEIVVSTLTDEWTYVVDEPWLNRGSPNVVVGPGTEGLLSDRGGSQLTLVALHPRFSSEARLVVIAELVDEPLDVAPVALAEDEIIGLRSEAFDQDRLLVGSAVAGVFWLVVWIFGRPRRRTVFFQLVALIMFSAAGAWTLGVAAESLPPY